MDGQATIGGPATVSVKIGIAGPLTWAGHRNHVAFLDNIAVSNNTAQLVRDLSLVVTCEPPFFARVTVALGTLNGESVVSAGNLRIEVDEPRLRTLEEAEEARVIVQVRHRDDVIATESAPLKVLAYNEWSRSLRNDLIATFVLPNHPAITELVALGRDLQMELFGKASFEGYQSPTSGGDPIRVMQQAHALYSAIQKMGVTYLGVPASFEESSQKLRPPEALRREKQGNCIELATWYAAALEACGLVPVIVTLTGHAFAGCWLHDLRHGSSAIETDPAAVRKYLAAKQLVLVETTLCTTRPAVDFVNACQAATAAIIDNSFDSMIDIGLARTQGVRPMATNASDPEIATAGVPVEGFNESIPDTSVPSARRRSEPKVRSRIDVWADSLLDLTLRNQLLGLTLDAHEDAWLGLRRKRGGVTLAIPDLGNFENVISDGEAFTLRTNGPSQPRGGPNAEFEAFLNEGIEQGIIFADLGGEDTAARVRELWKRHRTGLEEKGVSPLHLAFGFLKWKESDTAPQFRYAPLLLTPADIERASLTSDFKISVGEGETVFNAALVQKLRNDFDIDLSGLLETLPEDDYGIDVDAIFHEVTTAILAQKGFEVIRLAMLAPFEYRKQVMAKDLKAIAESKEASANEFLCKLEPRFADASRTNLDSKSEAPFVDPRALDDVVSPGALPLVVDCDSSQLSAVHAAMGGRSFVLQGPPGTGKSQTITNMIASLLAVGKRVLFVAEKRAALSVVAHRLERAGLGTACLELHSEKSDPSHVTRSLVESLDQERPVSNGSFARDASLVAEMRGRLNAFVRRLHEPTPLGMTFYLASARRHELRDILAPRVEHADHLETSSDLLARRLRALESLSLSISDCGGWASHPLRASRLCVWTEKSQEAIAGLLQKLASSAAHLAEGQSTAARVLGIPTAVAEGSGDGILEVIAFLLEDPPHWVRELAMLPDRKDYVVALSQLSDVATRRAERLQALAVRWHDGIHELDLQSISQQIRTSSEKWFLAKWWGLRGPKATLAAVAKGNLGELGSLLQDLEIAQGARDDARELDSASQAVIRVMGPAFAGSRTPASTFARAADVRRWEAMVETLNAVARDQKLPPLDPRQGVPTVSIEEIRALHRELSASLMELERSADAVIRAMSLDVRDAFGTDKPTRAATACATFATNALQNLPKLRDKTASEERARVATELGLGAFIAEVRAGRIPEGQIALCYEAGFLKTWCAEMCERHSVLAQFRGREHDRLIEAFRAADRALLEAGKQSARYAVMQLRPPPGTDAHSASDIGVLRRESMKKRRRMPVRRLLADLKHLVPKLKPCLLMSPLAVSHFLPVDCDKFDTVIFDEASQVRTADAIGSLWRGRQVIVVGDSKQMPPTDFFAGGLSDDDDDATNADIPVDTESILDEAVASGVPDLMLKWHYRSRDERLIAFSNHHYYDGRLLTFPAADAEGEGCGLDFVRVHGVYEKGTNRCNEVEARKVVSIVMERLLDPKRRDRSIGIVTFNAQQQDLIETLLEAERKLHPEVEGYFNASASEPVFVKNLENVQGDERDVMIFSTTFGRNSLGQISMNFGPMNKSGGERRLNVAVTRARERLIVVTSMDPEDIDLSRTAAAGVKHLREFLAYARDGRRALFASISVSPNSACESPFEVDVLQACEAIGIRVDSQVGCSGYRIDLAARDPACAMRYVLGIECDGATYHSGATARDRDRLRQSVLEGLGWTFHRIWSTDWALNRASEIERLKAAYEKALGSPRRIPGRGANIELRSTASAESAKLAAAPSPVRLVPVVPASPPRDPVDSSAVTDAMRRDAILHVLKTGGSIPRHALIKAAASHMGLPRLGSRIKSAIDSVISALLTEGRIRSADDRIHMG